MESNDTFFAGFLPTQSQSYDLMDAYTVRVTTGTKTSLSKCIRGNMLHNWRKNHLLLNLFDFPDKKNNIWYSNMFTYTD
jgi:hypothetical protein